MKVLEKGITSAGVKIQREDWSKDYSFHNFGDTVAMYPMCKKTISAWIKEGENFRLEMYFKTTEQAEKAYNNLLSGEKTAWDYLENIKPDYHDCIT